MPIILDITNPPTGSLNQFNAYVAISRGRSRESVRILRKFDPFIFTMPPSLNLTLFDQKL
jgi:hypothetical protein